MSTLAYAGGGRGWCGVGFRDGGDFTASVRRSPRCHESPRLVLERTAVVTGLLQREQRRVQTKLGVNRRPGGCVLFTCCFRCKRKRAAPLRGGWGPRASTCVSAGNAGGEMFVSRLSAG